MKKILALSLLVSLAGCSSSPDVRPGIDGIHRITIRGENIKDTEKAAHLQAVSFCKDQHKKVEFLSDEAFEASPIEVTGETSLFKKGEAVAVDLKFKCVEAK